MSELDANVVIDGQRAIATVAQTGTVISDGGAVDATCVIQTDDGPQKVVKTYDLNGGGGGGTVDQTYDPTSTNAQSGTAVAEAVQPYLKNKATGQRSLSILGPQTPAADAVVIGENTTANYCSNSVVVGCSASVPNSVSCVAVGYGSMCTYDRSVAIGSGSYASSNTSIAIGGDSAKAMSSYAIQLGNGTNSTANSFQVYSYTMLDGTTGKIPMARLPIVQISQADYDALVSGGTVDANTLYLIV